MIEELIQQLKSATNVQEIAELEGKITQLGESALPAIIRELEESPAQENLAGLLRAVSWMQIPPDFGSMRILRIIERYLATDNLDCRAAAVYMTRILSADVAMHYLRVILATSSDKDLHEEVKDAMDERGIDALFESL